MHLRWSNLMESFRLSMPSYIIINVGASRRYRQARPYSDVLAVLLVPTPSLLDAIYFGLALPGKPGLCGILPPNPFLAMGLQIEMEGSAGEKTG